MAGILPVGVIDLVGLIDAMSHDHRRAHETLHLVLNDGVIPPESA